MCNLCMCFVWIFWGLWIYVGGFYLFISLSIYLSTYGWYAMNYNFMFVYIQYINDYALMYDGLEQQESTVHVTV